MGVYIKGMEMPTSCPCELLGIGYDLYCSFAGEIPARVKEYYECCQNGARPSWCPLAPVQPHGRLIDADAFLALINDSTILSDFLKCIINPLIRGEPTVIEAEEGET